MAVSTGVAPAFSALTGRHLHDFDLETLAGRGGIAPPTLVLETSVMLLHQRPVMKSTVLFVTLIGAPSGTRTRMSSLEDSRSAFELWTPARRTPTVFPTVRVRLILSLCSGPIFKRDFRLECLCSSTGARVTPMAAGRRWTTKKPRARCRARGSLLPWNQITSWKHPAPAPGLKGQSDDMRAAAFDIAQPQRRTIAGPRLFPELSSGSRAGVRVWGHQDHGNHSPCLLAKPEPSAKVRGNPRESK